MNSIQLQGRTFPKREKMRRSSSMSKAVKSDISTVLRPVKESPTLATLRRGLAHLQCMVASDPGL